MWVFTWITYKVKFVITLAISAIVGRHFIYSYGIPEMWSENYCKSFRTVDSPTPNTLLIAMGQFPNANCHSAT